MKAPLWLPEGSIRALLALVVLGTVCAMYFLGKTVPEQLGTVTGIVLACYFSQRNNGSGPPTGTAPVTPDPSDGPPVSTPVVAG